MVAEGRALLAGPALYKDFTSVSMAGHCVRLLFPGTRGQLGVTV